MEDFFDWDEHNVEHIARHGVEPEEVMTDPQRVRQGARNVALESRNSFIGATEAGRILVVVYTKRRGKFRPITARDADNTAKRRYRKR